MKEKTLRWPGHIDLMRILRDLGLFSREPIRVQSQLVRPLNVTSALLFPHWTYDEGEEDFTVMRVIVEGTRSNQHHRLTWDMLDFFDRTTNTTSMARTTAFPCTILARTLLERGAYEPGVIVAEMIGRDAQRTQHVLGELERRGVRFRFHDTKLPPNPP
jgi:lysine 6-dehydrogenase